MSNTTTTAAKAYPQTPDYVTRAMAEYQEGDAVRVGPAYQMGGAYENDGVEGDYFVARACGDGNYRVARTPDGDWVFVVYAARLSPR